MSIEGRNAHRGSMVSVYRPTEGDDSIAWGDPTHRQIRLELTPVTDELSRQVFGANARVECMALTTLDIRKSDGVVVSTGPYGGSRFRVTAALPFRKFTQLGLQSTTEAIP